MRTTASRKSSTFSGERWKKKKETGPLSSKKHPKTSSGSGKKAIAGRLMGKQSLELADNRSKACAGEGTLRRGREEKRGKGQFKDSPNGTFDGSNAVSWPEKRDVKESQGDGESARRRRVCLKKSSNSPKPPVGLGHGQGSTEMGGRRSNKGVGVLGR